MKICVAGQGAFGQKHLDALKRIPGVEVTAANVNTPVGTLENQQQRLTIARALSHQPEILCLDEFSIAIDPVTTMRIEDVRVLEKSGGKSGLYSAD